jgi:hypothetical protein
MIAAFKPSRTEAKRKMSPSSPAISVWLKSWVWLVWISSGVRIQTFAAVEISHGSRLPNS